MKKRKVEMKGEEREAGIEKHKWQQVRQAHKQIHKAMVVTGRMTGGPINYG